MKTYLIKAHLSQDSWFKPYIEKTYEANDIYEAMRMVEEEAKESRFTCEIVRVELVKEGGKNV